MVSSRIVYFDLETRPNPKTRVQEVYAVGWQYYDDDGKTQGYQALFQQHPTDDVCKKFLLWLADNVFVPRLEQYEFCKTQNLHGGRQTAFTPVTLAAYNASGFDIHFLVSKLNKLRLLHDILENTRVKFKKTAGGLLMVEFFDEVNCITLAKTHDLNRIFNGVTLDKLSELATGKKMKSIFPHNAMHRLEDVSEYVRDRNPKLMEVTLDDFPPGTEKQLTNKFIENEPKEFQDFWRQLKTEKKGLFPLAAQARYYLQQDVDALDKTYQVIDKMFVIVTKASVLRFPTVTSCTWYMAMHTLPAKCINTKMDTKDKRGRGNRSKIYTHLWRVNTIEAQAIERAVYGGRVYPRCGKFESKNFKTWTTYYDIDDYLVYLDAHALYSCCLSESAFARGIHRWLKGKELEQLTQKLRAGPLKGKFAKRMVLKVRLTPMPTDVEPCIPRKDEYGQLQWDLQPRLRGGR